MTKKENTDKQPFIHSHAIVEEGVTLGTGTRVWAFSHILPGARIGDDCNICDLVFIESNVTIGNRVTVKSGVQLWDGARLEDDVFIGPNATFTNDKFPRSKQYPESYLTTVIKHGASIGANATILPGITIGAEAMVGAGAVVTQDVPPKAIVVGNPARISGYVDIKTEKSVDQEVSKHERKSYVSGVTLKELKHVSDLRGDISVAEFEKDIPFTVKRIFWVYNVPNDRVRGSHVHRQLHEYLVCVKGSSSVVADDGIQRQEFVLNHPSLALYLPPRVWRTLYKYTPDTVLLVFASHEYDPSDYIRDYDEFLELVKE